MLYTHQKFAWPAREMLGDYSPNGEFLLNILPFVHYQVDEKIYNKCF